jgi:site-specific DNA recombinase
MDTNKNNVSDSSSQSDPQAYGKSLGKATRYKSQKPDIYNESADAVRLAAIYVRISRDEDAEGQSLPTQEKLCREYIAREKKGWKIVGVYSDDESGKTDKRPGFQDLIDATDEGRVNAIVCLHLDRFSRNIHDILTYFYKLEKMGVYMAFAQEYFDFSTPDGRAQFHFLAAFADWYLKNLSRETKRGKKNIVDSGYQNNQVPFGYYRAPGEKDPRLVPEEAEIIQKIFEMYETGGYTDAAIALWINEQGFKTRKGKPWTKDAVRTTLQLDFYYGAVKHLSELFPGKHEPILSKGLFDRVQKVRKTHFAKPRSSTKRFDRVFLVNGIIRCSVCHKGLRAHGIRDKYRYYREDSKLRGDECKNAGINVNADEIEAQVGALIQNFILPDTWKKEIQAILDANDVVANINAQRAEVEAKLRRLGEAYTDGAVADDVYRSRRDKLKKQLDDLIIPNSEAMLSTGKQIESFRQVWNMASMRDREEMVKLIFEWVEVDVAKKRLTAVNPKRGDHMFFDQHQLLEKDEKRGGYRVIGV